MSAQPLLSVVVPCFNQNEFLSACLASIARATSRPHEVIVVDDGSTIPVAEDESLLGPAEAHHQQVRVVRQANLGLASARNTGLAQCVGEFVHFIDSDDLLLPRSLDRGVDRLVESSAPLLLGGYLVSDGSGRNLKAPSTQPYEFRFSQWQRLPALWEVEVSIPIHSAIFRHNALVPFASGQRSKEDWIFWSSLSQRGTSPVVTQDIQAVYRIHGRNMTREAGYGNSLQWLSALAQVRSKFPLQEMELKRLRSHFFAVYWRSMSMSDRAALRQALQAERNSYAAEGARLLLEVAS